MLVATDKKNAWQLYMSYRDDEKSYALFIFDDARHVKAEIYVSEQQYKKWLDGFFEIANGCNHTRNASEIWASIIEKTHKLTLTTPLTQLKT